MISRHVLASTLVAAVGVAAATGQVPARAAAAGEFVWHDLATADPAAARAFYGALFGWTFEDGAGVDPGYTIIRQQGQPIGGIATFRRERADAVSQWIAYVMVDDVDRTAAAFTQDGGRLLRGPLQARKDLRVALVSDAQGAPIGLANRGPAAETETPPGLHRWLWMEYVARDATSALAFYGAALGFRHEVQKEREDVTYYLLSTDRPRAGLFLSPWPRETSAWLPYVRVADPAAMAARAVELGGTIILPPRPGVRNGSLAIVLDPGGAPLALQRFPFTTGAAQ